MEEVTAADLLIHVRDIAHPDTEAQRSDVESVLDDIGVAAATPRLEAWNKLDLLDADARAALLADAAQRADVMAVSALSGEGVDALIRRVATDLTAGHRRYFIAVPHDDGAAVAWLHEHGEVLAREEGEEEAVYEVRLSPADHDRFRLRGRAHDAG